jgi:hypothetical protein
MWAITPAALFSLAWSLGIPFEAVSRDAADLYNFHPLTGVLSNLGVLLWTTSAAVLIFSASLIRHNPAIHQMRATLGRFAILSTILLVDDLFLIHEQVAPQNLGISEKLTYLLYAAVFVVCFWRSRSVLLNSRVDILAAALTGFALSIGLDLVPNWLPYYHYALEDTPKFIGIGLWTTFCIVLSQQSLEVSKNI